MKKEILLTMVAVAMLSACQAKQKADSFVLSASNLPAECNGAYAYVIEGDEYVDSILITDGAFTLTTDSLSPKKMSNIMIIDQIFFPFLKESGEFKVVITPREDKRDGYSVAPVDDNPNSLNSRLYDFYASLHKVSSPINAEYEAKYGQLYNGTSVPEDTAIILQMELNALSTKLIEETNKVAQTFYEENKDNAVGVLAFGYLSYEKDEDFIAVYESASDLVKADRMITEEYLARKQSMASDDENNMVDFTMEDGQGNTATLSDYIGDGRYLLVNLWASWSGPSREAMPHMATLNQKYASSLRVLSIGTFENSIEEYEKAIMELDITWDTFFDSKNAGATTYGIHSSVPYFMLISPGGNIVLATPYRREITAKIVELNL